MDRFAPRSPTSSFPLRLPSTYILISRRPAVTIFDCMKERQAISMPYFDKGAYYAELFFLNR
jgi:hypothetical protein